MMPAEQTERHGKRYALSFPVWVCLRKQKNASGSSRRAVWVEQTTTKDVSTGGCYFTVAEEPAVGSKAEMDITLPERLTGGRGARVHCRGRVIRVREEAREGRFGVACTIESYHLLPGTQPGTQEESRKVA